MERGMNERIRKLRKQSLDTEIHTFSACLAFTSVGTLLTGFHMYRLIRTHMLARRTSRTLLR